VDQTAALEPWRRAGLVASRDDALVARFKLTPFAGAIHASDFAQTGAGQALLHFTVRRPCRNAFDLGSGCGIQSFAAARHGERFDLIVSNPPFLISPSRRYQYRDSGLAGDEFCRGLIRQAPDLLEEGGFFQICLDWTHYRGMDWKERLAGWFDGSGCDVWVLRNQTEDPAAYAEHWIRDTEAEDAEPRVQLAGQWLDCYESRGIEAFSTGWIAMRRCGTRSNWLRFDEAPERTIEPFGEVVATVLALNDFLQDGDLIEQRLRLAPEVRLDHRSRWEEGRWIPVSTGIALARLDGRGTLGEVFAEIAGALGKPREEIAAECLDVLRGLVRQGFLLPAR